MSRSEREATEATTVTVEVHLLYLERAIGVDRGDVCYVTTRRSTLHSRLEDYRCSNARTVTSGHPFSLSSGYPLIGVSETRHVVPAESGCSVRAITEWVGCRVTAAPLRETLRVALWLLTLRVALWLGTHEGLSDT